MKGSTKRRRHRAREKRKKWKLIRDRIDEMRALRAELVQLLGGKCAHCGYNEHVEVLEFHHVNPKTKRFCITLCELWRPRDEIMEEVEKTALSCPLCHRLAHLGFVQF